MKTPTNYKHAVLKTIDGKLVVELNEEKEPGTNMEDIVGRYTPKEIKVVSKILKNKIKILEEKISQWQKNIVTVEVADSERSKFSMNIELLVGTLYGWMGVQTLYNKHLKEGVSISPELIEVKQYCDTCHITECDNVFCFDCIPKQFAFLKEKGETYPEWGGQGELKLFDGLTGISKIEPQPIRTAEEVLGKYFPTMASTYKERNRYAKILEAMDEYRNQFKTKQNEKL